HYAGRAMLYWSIVDYLWWRGRLLRVVSGLLLLLALFAGAPRAAVAAPAALDWDLGSAGHFFTQADPSGAGGFRVTNADGIGFWDTYRRTGGADLWGYPLSRRFDYQGSTVQVFQRGVLQSDPVSGGVGFLSV